MTTEEIVEGNRLIAEFMGYKQRENGGLFWGNDGLGGLYPKDLKYHSSWDWLMPVVEKIQHLEDELPVKIDFQIHLLGAVELYIDYKRVFAMTAFEPGTLINAVYEAILEFIKWYNENK